MISVNGLQTKKSSMTFSGTPNFIIVKPSFFKLNKQELLIVYSCVPLFQSWFPYGGMNLLQPPQGRMNWFNVFAWCSWAWHNEERNIHPNALRHGFIFSPCNRTRKGRCNLPETYILDSMMSKITFGVSFPNVWRLTLGELGLPGMTEFMKIWFIMHYMFIRSKLQNYFISLNIWFI